MPWASSKNTHIMAHGLISSKNTNTNKKIDKVKRSLSLRCLCQYCDPRYDWAGQCSELRLSGLSASHVIIYCANAAYIFINQYIHYVSTIHYRLKSPNPDRVPPEGDDITSLLGPGQVPPKPALGLFSSDISCNGFRIMKVQFFMWGKLICHKSCLL